MGQRIYWLIPLLLFIVQGVVTYNSQSQIRSEELSETVRSVYWLANKQVYLGGFTNLGWYGLLLAVYNTFGFDLFTAKFVKLALQLISLFCLSAFLKKNLGSKTAIIPLITIGLSPTFLYFNALQTPFGIDLQYLPICLWLISLQNKSSVLTYLKHAALGMVMMIAWMSYPTFVFYLPMLGYYWYRGSKTILPIFVILISFLLPLLASVAFVSNKSLIFYNHQNGGGIFRGAGRLVLNQDNSTNTIAAIFTNYFSKATSYHFELNQVEFSLFLPILSFVFTFYLCFRAFKHGVSKKITLTLLFVMLTNLLLIASSIDGGIAGARRNTPILASFYGLFSLGWYVLVSKKINLKPIHKKIIIAIMLILPIHHSFVLPLNINSLSIPSPFIENLWLGINSTPKSSFESYLNSVQEKDLYLNCQEQFPNFTNCSYDLIYSVIAGACTWNNLNCHNIYGFNSLTDGYELLSVESINESSQ